MTKKIDGFSDMQTDKKLLFVTNSLSGGGAERSANVITDELSHLGVAVHLVPLNRGAEDLVRPSCNIHQMNRKWNSSFLALFVTFFRLQVLTWRIKPTHLILNCDLPEFLGSLLIGNFKLIAVEHSSEPWTGRRSLGYLTRKVLSARSTTWIAVSNHLRIWSIKEKPDFVISNPIPRAFLVERLHSDRNRSMSIERLVFIGRLSPEKNPEMIIHIAHKTNLPVLFVGDGYLLEQLSHLSHALGVVSSFSGQQANPWDSCNDTDLIIVPSKYEGDGLVVVEAIIQGFPLLLSDIPDLLRFGLPNHNYANSVETFSSRISNYRNNKSALVASDSIRTSLVQSRHPEICASLWLSVLENLAS
jgi:GalNAc-alpha-(1->4)-GalNAc-alpha-(1->3)-diNAcBac-PP-undecaprenol alpha-1,4-N-acetyl-D-galactosaminyltransferase